MSSHVKKGEVHKDKRKRRGKIISLIVSFIIILIAMRFTCGFDIFGKMMRHEASMDKGWNLILVNEDNYIPDDYQPELMSLSNGRQIDSRIYPELQAMFDDARALGYRPFVREGYRTEEEQQEMMDEKVAAFVAEGESDLEAKKLAEDWVAVPGTSEHELGIAVDINSEESGSESDSLYQWLSENAYKYGFIQRYPPDKSDITGISYEPWHYRYVGPEAAKEIYCEGICLEEYLG